MRDRDGFLLRFVARIRALAPEDWSRVPGRLFRRSADTIVKYNREHVHIEKKLDDAPDLAWKAVEGAALQKHAAATLQYAQEENQKIETELQRRVLDAKVRQEHATADKLEAEARIAQIREVEARLELAKKLSDAGVTLVAASDGSLTAISAPSGYNWEALGGELGRLAAPAGIAGGPARSALPERRSAQEEPPPKMDV